MRDMIFEGTPLYTLERELLVSSALADTWNFLRNPANLNQITPPDLHFHIVSDIPAEMYNGLVIEYRISIPIIGARTWVAEIKHIREKHSFVDEQRVGPFKLWYHYHQLEEVDGRTKIIDRVHYALPYFQLGSLIHVLFVRKTLQRIFDYRKDKLTAIFNK